MHFLMTCTLGLNLDDSCVRTSFINMGCFKTLRVFIILTMAAWIRTLRSSSMVLWVISISCFCSVFIGKLMLTRNFLFRYSWNSEMTVLSFKSSSEIPEDDPAPPASSLGFSAMSSLDLRMMLSTCLRMSILISVTSDKDFSVQRSQSLNWSKTAIWKVEACSVYLFLKQLVVSSPLDMW